MSSELSDKRLDLAALIGEDVEVTCFEVVGEDSKISYYYNGDASNRVSTKPGNIIQLGAYSYKEVCWQYCITNFNG